MTSFFNETPFVFPYNKNSVKRWVKSVAKSEGKEAGNINYIFCDDEYLHKINVEYLQHDTLTDIITFDYSGQRYKLFRYFVENNKTQVSVFRCFVCNEQHCN